MAEEEKIYNLGDFGPAAEVAENENGANAAKSVEEELLDSKNETWKAIRLGARPLHIRKWKVRDRLKLKKFAQSQQDAQKQQEGTLQILVFGCIQEQIGLNKDELEYMFAQLRTHSIGDETEFSYNCTNLECNKLNKAKMKVSQIYKPEFGKIDDIKTENLYIQLQDIQNPKYYNKKMLENQYDDLTDLVLHIKTINGKELKEREILAMFEELDTDEMDYIFDIWDSMRFTINRENTLICEHCGAENTFEFDEIPNLIPPIWFRR